MIRALTWQSDETSPTLTAAEVESLSDFTLKCSELGLLSKGYIGANYALYWQRIKNREEG